MNRLLVVLVLVVSVSCTQRPDVILVADITEQNARSIESYIEKFASEAGFKIKRPDITAKQATFVTDGQYGFELFIVDASDRVVVAAGNLGFGVQLKISGYDSNSVDSVYLVSNLKNALRDTYAVEFKEADSNPAD